jgi:hypothetical protein
MKSWPRYLVDEERFSTSVKPSTIAHAQGCRIESALPTYQAYVLWCPGQRCSFPRDPTALVSPLALTLANP